MKPIFQGPRSALERKPKHGQPCNGCGLCCMAVPCKLAKRVFLQDHGRCPALVQVEKHTYACGLTMDNVIPEPLREAAKLLIFAGVGCDARFNGEAADPEFYAAIDKFDAIHQDKLLAAKQVWRDALNPQKGT